VSKPWDAVLAKEVEPDSLHARIIRYLAVNDLSAAMPVSCPMHRATTRRWPWSKPIAAPTVTSRAVQQLDDHHAIVRCGQCHRIIACVRYDAA
jgi:hypothetical protein